MNIVQKLKEYEKKYKLTKVQEINLEKCINEYDDMEFLKNNTYVLCPDFSAKMNDLEKKIIKKIETDLMHINFSLTIYENMILKETYFISNIKSIQDRRKLYLQLAINIIDNNIDNILESI